jgi:LSD1 subclass zinc finger protein
MARRTVFSMGGPKPFIHYREISCKHICECESVLSYPVGAQIIKCPECNSLRRISIDNEYVQTPCVLCLSQLLIPKYSSEFKCPACHTELKIKICTLQLSQVQEHDRREEQRLELLHANKKKPEEKKEIVKDVIVVVENPPSVLMSEGKLFEKTNKAFGIEFRQAAEPPTINEDDNV